MKNTSNFNVKQFLAENALVLKQDRDSVPAVIQTLSSNNKKALADFFFAESHLDIEFLEEDHATINRVLWVHIRQRANELFFVNREAKFKDIHFAENNAVAQASIAVSSLCLGEVKQLNEVEVFELNDAIARAFDAMNEVKKLAELAKARFAEENRVESFQM